MLQSIASPIVFKDKIKTWNLGGNANSVSQEKNSNLIFTNLNPFSNTVNTSAATTKKDYSMLEPFASNGMNAMSYPMKKSMDPSTWMSIMMGMMNPHQSSPAAMCAKCHEGEDLARYQHNFGPMMQSMWSPYQNMMNPMMMNQLMHQMASPMTSPGQAMQQAPVIQSATPMSPEEYKKWYNEQLKKHQVNQR